MPLKSSKATVFFQLEHLGIGKVDSYTKFQRQQNQITHVCDQQIRTPGGLWIKCSAVRPSKPAVLSVLRLLAMMLNISTVKKSLDVNNYHNNSHI